LTRAIGSQSKLIEMLVLDDDEVKELSEEGSTLGITIDDISRMSIKELRAALRFARDDLEAKDHLVKVKNEKIDKLIAGKKFQPAPDAIARNAQEQKHLDELHQAGAAFEPMLLRLGNVYEAIGSGASPAVRKRCEQVAEFIAVQLADLIETYSLKVDITRAMDLRPDWVVATEGQATANN
jgi:hypothetical protein